MLNLNILFPVYNEEKRLRRGIETTCAYLLEHMKCEYCLTIVDNGSSDKTEAISLELCNKYSFVKYIKTTEKGVGAAFQLGVAENTFDIVGYMDIDLSTDIHHIADMYQIFSEEPDVQIVNASRLHKNSCTTGRKWYRNITSHGLAKLIRFSFNVKMTDVICGFKFFRKDVVKELVKETFPNNGWFYIIELLIRAERNGIKTYELPVKWLDDYDTTVNVKKLILYYLNNIFFLKKRLKRENQ